MADRDQGQWAPMVGTGLAILGSLYLLLAKEVENLKKEEIDNEKNLSQSIPDRCTDNTILGSPVQSPVDIFTSDGRGRPPSDTATGSQAELHDVGPCANCGHYHREGQSDNSSRVPGTGVMGGIARFIMMIDEHIDGMRQELFGDDEPIHEEPAIIDIPGQLLRVRRDTGASRTPSRAPSSRQTAGESPGEGSRTASPQPPQTPRSPSPGTVSRRSTVGDLPAIKPPFDVGGSPSFATGALANRRRSRGDSLQVPQMAHTSPLRMIHSAPKASEDGEAEAIEDISRPP